MFDLKVISAGLANFVEKAERKQFMVLSRIGEEFVNKAREKQPSEGSFTDQTGNLRSSIGYIIVKDGHVLKEFFPGGKPVGSGTGKDVAKDLAATYVDGFILIVVAGMDYAAAVESTGWDVITGSIPLKHEVKNLLKEWLDLK